MKRYILLNVLLVLLAVPLAMARVPVADELPELLEELYKKNPEIKSLTQKILAKRDLQSASGYPQDPRLSAEAMDVPLNNLAAPMGGYRFVLSQMVPFPSKLITRHALARDQTEVARQMQLEKINQLTAQFKITYFDYLFASEAIAIDYRNERRLNAMLGVLESKYATGKGLQQDLLKTRVEIQKIREDLTRLRYRQKTLLARLNTWLTRPVDQKLLARFSYRYLRPLSRSDAELVEYALRERPWLKMADFEVSQSQKKESLTRQALLPDFEFMAGYTVDGSMPVTGMRQDFVSGGVGVTLPFLWTLPAHVQKTSAAKHATKAMDDRREALREEIRFAVSDASHSVRETRDQIHLYATQILPQSQSALDSASVAYEAGAVDYLNLITSQITLFKLELMDARYRYDYAKAVAKLEMAVGRPLTEME